MQPVGDAQLLAERQRVNPQNPARQMKRRPQPIPRESADAAIGRHEVQGRLWRQELLNPERPAKMGEVRAATHGHVLTKIDQFAARRIDKTAGPPPQSRFRFEKGNAHTLRSEGDRRGESGQAAANDDDAISGHTP